MVKSCAKMLRENPRSNPAQDLDFDTASTSRSVHVTLVLWRIVTNANACDVTVSPNSVTLVNFVHVSDIIVSFSETVWNRQICGTYRNHYDTGRFVFCGSFRVLSN